MTTMNTFVHVATIIKLQELRHCITTVTLVCTAIPIISTKDIQAADTCMKYMNMKHSPLCAALISQLFAGGSTGPRIIGEQLCSWMKGCSIETNATRNVVRSVPPMQHVMQSLHSS